MKLHGNKIGSKLISKVFDPKSATEVMAAFENSQRVIMRKKTSEEALEMMITCNLTKSTYNEIRFRVQRHGHDLYPPYKQIFV